MRKEYFFSFIVGTGIGIVSENIFSFGYPLGVLCVVLGLITVLLKKEGRYVTWGFGVSLFLFGCALGMLRVDVNQHNENIHALDDVLGINIEIRGIVVREPDVRENYTNIVLESVEAEPAGSRLGRHLGREINSVRYSNLYLLARIPVYPEIKYGDEVLISGKITVPTNFSNASTGRSFDYQSYLAKENIFYEMYFPKVSLLAHHKGNSVREKLFQLKEWLMNNIAEKIPEPEASLGGGITLGAKQSLGTELTQTFRETGLAHIVVLSGYNIAVVASVIARVVSFLPFAFRIGATAGGIIIFALMVGADATVLRATLMALVVILARVLGRDGSALRALLLVGFVMILLNPMIILHDVSFQLSFMATLSLALLAPLIENYFTRYPFFMNHNVMREIFVTTLSTQIFVAPILLYQMGTISIIGIATNLLVLPFVPLSMLLVSLVAILAWVPIISTVIAIPAQLLLTYIIFVATKSAELPFASLHFDSFGVYALIFSYAIIFGLCFREIQKQKNINKPTRLN